MQKCAYHAGYGSAHIDFGLPRSRYHHSFKIDTGAALTLIPMSEFRNFFPKKKLENGEMRILSSASGDKMKGYTHKVLVHIDKCNKAKLMSICFYSGKRALLGIDMIREHFQICFTKDSFAIALNDQ